MTMASVSTAGIASVVDSWRLSRRTLMGVVSLLVASQSAGAASGTLLGVVSLRDELTEALKRGNPLVVLVSLDGCPFCKTVRNNYLIPLRQQERLSVLQIDMQSAVVIMDLDGTTLTHDDLVRRWNVKIAPTVLFLGPRGVEVVPRLVGVASPDFYGAYLDQRLAQARVILNH
jgi:thioredoxin-related protein